MIILIIAPVFVASNVANALLVKQRIVTEQQQLVKVKRTLSILEDPPNRHCDKNQHAILNYITYLNSFRCGNIVDYGNGTIIRHFTLIADDYHGIGKPINITTNKTDPVQYHAWMFNGSVPGPTMRMTEGDHVQITVKNANESLLSHSFHMHSFHSGHADGIMGMGGAIPPGAEYTYDFIASPAGVYPYHCHMNPVIEHILRGLYGMFIIDPKKDRSPATEMVMMLNGYSFNIQGLSGNATLAPQAPPTAQELRDNFSLALEKTDEAQFDNQFYTVNGVAFAYTANHTIGLFTHTPYRIYIASMTEFDPINSFHLHGNMFWYTPSGTLNSSRIYTDIIILAQGDRGIIDFTVPYVGDYMFHAHLNHFSDLGWMGMMHVMDINKEDSILKFHDHHATRANMTTTNMNMSKMGK